MELKSRAFPSQGTIPRRFARDGEDLSPPLAWSDLPDDTQALALVLEDPDAPRGTFTHWLVWDIPITSDELPEGVRHIGKFFEDGRRQGENDFGEHGYSGPMPPRGETHRYVFRLFALDAPLRLSEGASREELFHVMQGHVLEEADLVGRYRR